MQLIYNDYKLLNYSLNSWTNPTKMIIFVLKLFDMEAKDLRIGNYVQSGKGIYTVSVITEDGVAIIKNSEGRIFDGENTILKPIPLTNEFILECGFANLPNAILPIFSKFRYRIETSIFSKKGYSFRIKLDRNTSVFICDIMFVHELQNAWKTCEGSELIMPL